MDGAVVVRAHGGPEVLEWTSADPGRPGPGEVLIRHTAVGLNYIDVYHREGLYPLALPFTPGVEGTGRVVELGDDVDDLSPGDAVAYTGNGPVGSYREGRVLPRTSERINMTASRIGSRVPSQALSSAWRISWDCSSQ